MKYILATLVLLTSLNLSAQTVSSVSGCFTPTMTYSLDPVTEDLDVVISTAGCYATFPTFPGQWRVQAILYKDNQNFEALETKYLMPATTYFYTIPKGYYGYKDDGTSLEPYVYLQWVDIGNVEGGPSTLTALPPLP